MKRLFAAIKVHPSEAFLARYFTLQKNLKKEKIKWVDPGNIHITLKFFGETPDHHIPDISVALKQAAQEITPFEYNINNTGIFGSSYNPRLIWFGIDPQEGIIQLSESILSTLEQIGIEKDRQNFVPHLTIARIKMLEDKQFFQKVIDKNRECFIQKEEVNEFYLLESQLSPKGPKYSIIDSYKMLKI